MIVDVQEVKLQVYVPEAYIGAIRDALHDAGFLRVGEYDQVTSWQSSEGTWRPLEKAHPFDGTIGQLCHGFEVKLEVRSSSARAKEAIQIIRRIHPYEEPVIDIIPLIHEEQL